MLARHCNLTLGQALQSSQSLPTVPLLDTDVDVVLLGPNLFSVFERVSLVCEGVCRSDTSRLADASIDGARGTSARKNWMLTESREVLHVHATNGKLKLEKE